MDNLTATIGRHEKIQPMRNEMKGSRLPIFFLFSFLVFILAATLGTSWQCSTGGGWEDDDTGDCNCPSTPVDRCRQACDVIYGCGFYLPDAGTGAPLSVVECRSGCEKDPGNIDCVDNCVDSYQDDGDCDDLERCVADLCAIPIGRY